MNIAATLQERFYRWALRGRPPESSPVVLTQRRVYVLPTRQGLAFAVTLLENLRNAERPCIRIGLPGQPLVDINIPA